MDLEEIIEENQQSIEKPKAKRVMSDAQKDALRKGREKKAELAKINNEIIEQVVKTEMIPKITKQQKAEIMSKLKDEAKKTPPPSLVKKYKKIKKVEEESSDEEVVIERVIKKKPKKVEVQEVPKVPRLIRL
jgi:hypothetical protein